jgi:hypothetical protein
MAADPFPIKHFRESPPSTRGVRVFHAGALVPLAASRDRVTMQRDVTLLHIKYLISLSSYRLTMA